jgi:hypothetical protein
VAVKEYMPASLAGRTATMYVSLRSQTDAETFALGLKSFVNEARLLARFDHPSLLKVYRFWEANGTAYMAMPVLKGQTVKEVRMQMQGAPDETWLRTLLTPLLGAIENLHAEGVFHRDIAPDNIQVEPDGRPVLLDFGAARRVISDKTQSLTAILKPAYAPIEQYAEVGAVKQGPWTDIYALGATLHYLLLGRPPSPATARAVHDEASALTAANLPGCSENFLAIVNWMLAPRPGDRPQSVAALRAALQGQAPVPAPPPGAQPDAAAWAATQVLPRAVAAPSARAEAGLGAGSEPAARPQASAADATVIAPARPRAAAATVGIEAAARPAPPAQKRRSRALPVALAVGAASALALGLALWPRQPATQAQAGSAASAPPAVAALPAASASPAEVASAPLVQTGTAGALPAVVAPVSEPPASAATPQAALLATMPAPTPRKTVPAPGKPAATTARSEVPAQSAAAGGTAANAGPPPMSRPPPVDEAAPARMAAPETGKVQAAASAPAPVPAPATAAPATEIPRAAGSGPEATCSGRRAVMYFVCMERECLKSALTSHPDCLNWRKGARRE